MSTSRLEKFIYAICSMEVSDLPAPLSRIEILWNCLITGETPDFEPQSRNEKYLMAMLGLYDLNQLPIPMSRGEKLLYKIAMGETDLSDIPAYLSRYEELLGYLAENGGVGDFEYILQTLNHRLSMLYSTKERPMKQALIKGDTLVNELPRPSLKNTMTNVASQKLNQGYDTVNAVDGEFKSAILSGMTLVNITSDKKIVGSNYIRVEVDNNLIKPNVQYTLIVNGYSNVSRISCVDGNGLNPYFNIANPKQWNIFTTPNDLTNHHIRVYGTSIDDTLLNSIDIILVEGDCTNINTPYFTGMQSVKLPVLTTIGKNLFNSSTATDGYEFNVDKLVQNSSWFVSDFIKTEPNTTYVFSGKTGGNRVVFYDINKNKIGNNVMSDNKITTIDNCYYMRINGLITEKNTWQVEEGTVATPYEPYQSNTLTLSEPVNLRKVGDVEDEFDALTGRVTERIGEVVLDGSADELWSVDTSLTNHYKFLTPLANDYYKGRDIIASSVISDKYPSINNGEDAAGGMDVESICINGWAPESRGRLNLSISKTKLSDGSVEALKTYLQQNPFTVQYRLATPTTKTVNPTITDQDGVTQTKLHSFNDGYLSVSSQGLLPSAVNYEVPTNNSYYLPDMLTLGAQYTARGSADCNATIDGKLLALGMNKTFTTPSSVTDKLMVLDAPVDDLMFIKGDQTAKDFGYFEGMKSVEMSGIQVTGKNLFDGVSYIDGYIYGDGNTKVKPDSNVTSILVNLEKNTDYIVSTKTYFDRNLIGGSATPISIDNYVNSIDVNKIGNTILFNSGNYTYFIIYLNNGKIELKDLQVEKGSVATPYEPYKSTTLTLNEPVTLRKVGNVQDMLDGLTGEVVQNIGEIVLDGSENWSLSSNNPTNTDLLRFTMKSALLNAKKVSSDSMTHYLTDKFEKHIDWNNMECAWVHYSNSRVNVVIKKDKLTSLDANGLQSWLSLNPITVQYQLETESTKTIDLTTVDQDGQPTKLKTFNDISYVEINADNIIPSVDLEVATKISETLSTIEPQQLNISKTQHELGQTIEEQTKNTDATMMATTEIYEQTL